ncbi:hypothetical protein QUF76_19240 [Desulfobacterales bacterium HSG16]|nr:hypothetical protein [Desulfobacterales bacterium HSG16]
MATNINDQAIMDQAVEIAEIWQKKANELVTKDEKSVQQMMMRLLRNPMDKVVLTKMIDQSFRAKSTKRVADQVSYVMNKFGVPKFFSTPEKALMNIFLAVGQHVSMISIPQMIKKIRQDSSRSIIPGELDQLHAHLKKRKQEEVRMNLNHLGEAVLGEDEAAGRLDTYIKDMEDPEIEYISVKISTIYSQISSLAFDHTVEVLKDRLSKLDKINSFGNFRISFGKYLASVCSG